ncbi:hypothetical protein BDQ17DRAFT_1362850 [Cyathus striatus]|nr:hypothetical protein BDQ17DRAFT_1362850 [Cyathus striatus]
MYQASSDWAKDVASYQGSEKADHLTHVAPTSATSTAAADLLPAPVTQGTGSNSVGGKNKRRVRVGVLRVTWARFKKRVGTGTAPSSSSPLDSHPESAFAVRRQGEGEEEGDSDPVDEVVVDRVWSEEVRTSTTHSELGGSPEKSGSHPVGATSDHESVLPEGIWGSSTPLIIIRYRIWPAILGFFSTRFIDEASERHYAQEDWFLKKSLALWASVWLIVNWVLGCAFIPHNPVVNMDKVFYFGVAPVLSLPILFMVMYDWPRDRSFFYQAFLVVSIWCWSFYQVLFILLCGYYTSTPNCQGRDFLGTFYYTSALQTIALFGLKLNRFPAAVGAMVFYLFASATMIPLRRTWGRSLINFFIFQFFLIYVHYMRESSERRLYILRDQLKMQYRATQKAQINEKKTADSKRRLTSYVFHEVRVPLNTALLAVQNMEASGTIAKDQEVEFNALSGSLTMMSKVLNDVLDFNRMDSGKFESASRPYAFHQVMRSLFIPLRMSTDARGLELETHLDPNIDMIARRATYEATGVKEETIRKEMQDHPEVEGVVTGDETRLRQIITNLTSNACKFTPTGGKLTIATKLVLPEMEMSFREEEDLSLKKTETGTSSSDNQHSLSASHLSKHNIENGKSSSAIERIVVRIEVTDTGYGIKPDDMAHSRLFSAFNQTEQGRQQGGKGTGLGLALVRQIVKMTGGRLGVRSKVGEGSTFWVELPLGVGRKALTGPHDMSLDGSSTASSNLDKIKAAAAAAGVTNGQPEGMTNDIIRVVDAAAMKATRIPSHTARKNAAMHSLMEQGGRVELMLKNDDSQTTVPTRTIGDMSTGTQFSLLLSCSSDNPSESPQQTNPRDPEGEASDALSATTLEVSPSPSVQGRPTFVPLPSPRSFSMESQPPPTTSTLSHTSAGSSAGLMNSFGASHARNSPASSNATLHIMPGMPVLVVDDDNLTRTLMKRLLTRLGCTVTLAENGEIALELILGRSVRGTPSTDASCSTAPILEQREERINAGEESRYAVIFLDNQMPVMSGLEVVEKLRELKRKDFVVGVTGNALLSDQNEYYDAGVDRVLTKPVLERSLREMLIVADERRKTQQQQSTNATTPTT